jgi:hypothetical protein
MARFVSGIICDLGGFSWFVGLWTCWLCCGSKCSWKELAQGACLSYAELAKQFMAASKITSIY